MAKDTWRRHGEKIYFNNRAFAAIVPGLDIQTEREFDRLVDLSIDDDEEQERKADQGDDDDSELRKSLLEAITTEKLSTDILTKLQEAAKAGGWNMLTVGQLEDVMNGIDWPDYVQPNVEGFNNE